MGRLFGHNKHQSKSGGSCAPFNTMWPGPRPTSVPSGILIHPVAQPFGHNIRGPNIGGGCAPLGELGPHLTQYALGQSLPPYQVASWSIQPFGYNRHGPKIRGCAPFLGAAWSPSNTLWPGPLLPRGLPLCQVSTWSVQPFGGTNITDSQDRTDRTTVAQKGTNFNNFWYTESKEIWHKWLWMCPPHPKIVTTLSCEIQNSFVWSQLYCSPEKVNGSENGGYVVQQPKFQRSNIARCINLLD